MKRNVITLSIVSCFIVALVGCSARPDLESERNLKTRHEEPGPSLLSFVDMHTYALVLSDLLTGAKAKVDLKALPGWPGPAPQHTLLLPNGKKVLVTYMASATEPVGIAVININSINWVAGTGMFRSLRTWKPIRRVAAAPSLRSLKPRPTSMSTKRWTRIGVAPFLPSFMVQLFCRTHALPTLRCGPTTALSR